MPGAQFPGATLQDPQYVEFVRSLASGGFEIALHNVRNHHAPREIVRLGLERFRDCLGFAEIAGTAEAIWRTVASVRDESAHR